MAYWKWHIYVQVGPEIASDGSPQGFLDNLVPLTPRGGGRKQPQGPSGPQGLLGDAVPSPLPPRSDAAERGSPGPGPPAGPAAQRHGGRHPHGSHLNPQHPIKFLLTHAPAPVTVVPQDWAGGDRGETSLSLFLLQQTSPRPWAGDAWALAVSQAGWCSLAWEETWRQAGRAHRTMCSHGGRKVWRKTEVCGAELSRVLEEKQELVRPGRLSRCGGSRMNKQRQEKTWGVLGSSGSVLLECEPERRA